jgi:hypothetical protein
VFASDDDDAPANVISGAKFAKNFIGIIDLQ